MFCTNIGHVGVAYRRDISASVHMSGTFRAVGK